MNRRSTQLITRPFGRSPFIFNIDYTHGENNTLKIFLKVNELADLLDHVEANTLQEMGFNASLEITNNDDTTEEIDIELPHYIMIMTSEQLRNC